jgi:hypothetical protein
MRVMAVNSLGQAMPTLQACPACCLCIRSTLGYLYVKSKARPCITGSQAVCKAGQLLGTTHTQLATWHATDMHILNTQDLMMPWHAPISAAICSSPFSPRHGCPDAPHGHHGPLAGAQPT